MRRKKQFKDNIMLVLGIESTCDETACAIVRGGKEILSNVVASQEKIHEAYGGVFPEVAARRHSDVIISIIHKSLSEAQVNLKDIDLIAVAHGPGLIGAILIGLNAAKSLALSGNIPFIGVNHVEAHLYASLMSQPTLPSFPCIGVVLSGAHTHLVQMHAIGEYELIGQTIDDALGEAFDKVARVLGLPYPGGPVIEKLAVHGDSSRYPFKTGRVKNRPYDFSFSGIKTGVLYTVKGQKGDKAALTEYVRHDVAASFQHVVFTDVIRKTIAAAREKNSRSVIFGGGVTNNKHLRKMFADAAPDLDLLWPSVGLSLDNAAMIAGLGYHQYMKRGEGASYHLEALPRIPWVSV
jgi:N6-L-threonylcarbamoyladenine synthase